MTISYSANFKVLLLESDFSSCQPSFEPAVMVAWPVSFWVFLVDSLDVKGLRVELGVVLPVHDAGLTTVLKGMGKP